MSKFSGKVLAVLAGQCSLVGCVVTFNALNGIEVSFIDVVLSTLIYQFALFCIGGLLGIIILFFLPKEEKEPEKTEKVSHEEDHDDFVDDGFNIKDVITEDSKVIGKYLDSNIYDVITVEFENGYSHQYRFETTIPKRTDGRFDANLLGNGALLLYPGIVYAPKFSDEFEEQLNNYKNAA